MTGPFNILMLILLVAVCEFSLSVLQLRGEYMNSPGADKPIRCDDGVVMKRSDCHIRVILPKKSWWPTWQLARMPDLFILAIIYASSGAVGSCLYFLLASYKPDLVRQQRVDDYTVMVLGHRILIGGLSGILFLMILIAGGQGLALFVFLSNLSPDLRYEHLLILPVLTGIFLNVFYKGLADAFEKLFRTGDD